MIPTNYTFSKKNCFKRRTFPSTFSWWPHSSEAAGSKLRKYVSNPGNNNDADDDNDDNNDNDDNDDDDNEFGDDDDME